MRTHPRTKVCQQAEIEMRGALLDGSKKHDLTDIEYLRAVNQASSDALASCTKYMLRVERHGNAETQADSAGDGEKTAATTEIAERVVVAVAEALGNRRAEETDGNFDAALDAAYGILREEF